MISVFIETSSFYCIIFFKLGFTDICTHVWLGILFTPVTRLGFTQLSGWSNLIEWRREPAEGRRVSAEGRRGSGRIIINWGREWLTRGLNCARRRWRSAAFTPVTNRCTGMYQLSLTACTSCIFKWISKEIIFKRSSLPLSYARRLASRCTKSTDMITLYEVAWNGFCIHNEM